MNVSLFVTQKRQSLDAVYLKATVPHEKVIRELESLGKAKIEAGNKYRAAIDAFEAFEKKPEVASAQAAVADAKIKRDSFERGARFIPLYEVLEPLKPILVNLPDEMQRKMISTMAVAGTPLFNALVTAAPRSGDPKKPAKLTEKTWNEIQTGLNRAAEIAKEAKETK